MRRLYPLFRLVSLLTGLGLVFGLHGAPESTRERTLLDAGWRFAFGHATDARKDFGHATGYFSYLAKTGYGDGPANRAFDDRTWRLLDLPHDWAVEAPFDPRGSASHGFKAIGRNFPERSVGWYRKTVFVPQADLGRRIHLKLDGASRAARVFINGFFVGEEASGYLDAEYDLTDYLRYGEDNVIAVRVDATMEEGWYYEGAGIYRHVWWVKSNPLHVAPNGTWVRTEVGETDAAVVIETRMINEGAENSACRVEQRIYGPDGSLVAQNDSTKDTSVAPGAEVIVLDKIAVKAPQLWNLEKPALYRLVTTLRQAGRELDRYETPFGIRTIRFDPNAGFFLNGQRVELKGTNNHQDHAGVGVALPDALQEFRIRRLLEMGSNAYRCSHNPPTPELLDACDRLGMLVIDENRLMGANEYHLSQLERMIRRDRNHPSVILWSVGNEEWAIEGNITGARLATTMQRVANRLDPTRLATAAISGGWGGISTTIQAAGVNYLKQADPDLQHAKCPWQVILGTEETTTQGTRGIFFDDRPRAHLSPQENGSSGGNAERGWQYYAARPWAAGVFYWTGFDYRGEPTPFGYPAIASQFGILDLCGFPKDSVYYLKSWWGDKPVLHISPHWNWPDRVGQPMSVRVDSNCDEVELWLNGVSLGRKVMPVNGHLTWTVAYSPGELLARGYRAGKEVLSNRVVTVGAPSSIALQPDRTELHADGRDISVVTISIQDREGRFVPTANVDVSLKVSGPGRIIGVGNGDPSCLEPDRFVDRTRVVLVGAWRAPDPSVKTGQVDFEGAFDRPPVAAGETLTLLLNALGTSQSATLNGEPLYRDAVPGTARAEIPLDASRLKPTGNSLRIQATRFTEWRDREGLAEFRPATLKITTPAPVWRRTTFNGLAQVIIQSSGEAGEIRLEAQASTVTSQTVSLSTK